MLGGERPRLGLQTIALGPRRQPRGLAGIAGAPEVAAIGVDPLARPGHCHAVGDLGQLIDEPDALEQAACHRVADRDDLDQRPRARRRRE